MLTIRNGYGPNATVLATVEDRDAAKAWCADNGYGPLSIQMKRDEYRVARLTTAAEWSNPNWKA